MVCVIFIAWFRQHGLCIDTLYVKSLEHVSAFRPSTGVVHAPLTYLIGSKGDYGSKISSLLQPEKI
jgi:hypothetical protein